MALQEENVVKKLVSTAHDPKDFGATIIGEHGKVEFSLSISTDILLEDGFKMYKVKIESN